MQRIPTFITSDYRNLVKANLTVYMRKFFRHINSVPTWPSWFKPVMTVGSLVVMLLTVGNLMGQNRKVTFKVDKEVNGVMTKVDTTILITPDTDMDQLMRSLGIKPHADFNGLARPVVVGDSMRSIRVDVNKTRKEAQTANLMRVTLGGETIDLKEKDGFWTDGKDIKIPVETGGVLTVNGESIQLMGRGGAVARTTLSSQPTLRLSVWPLEKTERNMLRKLGPSDATHLSSDALKSVWQPAGFRIIPDAGASTYTLGFNVPEPAAALVVELYPSDQDSLQAMMKTTRPNFSGDFEEVWKAEDLTAGTYWLHIRHGAQMLWRKINLDE